MARVNIMIDLIIVGGGPAGIFAAIWAKTIHPSASIAIFEKSPHILSKLKRTGGGRCNLTNACFDPKKLAEYYPRGNPELIGPFTKWSPRETIQWFESRGILLKTETGGRVFPKSDCSDTIVNCLLQELNHLKIPIHTNITIDRIEKSNDHFIITTPNGDTISRKLILATGSNKNGFYWAEKLGHSIIPPIPSLFAFDICSFPYKTLSGTTLDPVEVQIDGFSRSERGSILITHFGFSGPAILKLSSFQARILKEQNYNIDLIVNWLPDQTEDQIFSRLNELKPLHPNMHLTQANPYYWPKSLWKEVVAKLTSLPNTKTMNEITLKDLRSLSHHLRNDCYRIRGPAANQEEFVTCGGIHRSQIHFQTMESKVCPNLYLVGEILDIDGITGGFNLQHCWTSGYLAGLSALRSD